MKVYRITILVVDHDELGADEASEVIENVRFPNDCISPTVLRVETRDVEWSDDHPLNITTGVKRAAADLFGVGGEWKIIRKSNYDHEDHRGDQYVVASEISNERQARLIAKLLNEHAGEKSDDYFEVVPFDHVLRPDWEP